MLIKERQGMISRLSESIKHKAALNYEKQKARYEKLYGGIKDKTLANYEKRRQKFEILVTQLNAMSPSAKLINGFGYITVDEKPLISTEAVSVGTDLKIRIHDGRISAKVTEVNTEKK